MMPVHRPPEPPSHVVYEGYHIHLKRDSGSGFYDVTFWPVGRGLEVEGEGLGRGPFESKRHGLDLAKGRIDELNWEAHASADNQGD